MKNVFSFCNQKGGVGKTTTAVNIAACLSEKGYKTLLIDLDAQGNATSGLGQEKPSLEFTTYQLIVEKSDPQSLIRNTEFKNLYLIPSNSDLSGAELEMVQKIGREYVLKNQLAKIKEQYDFILIDCPPSLGLMTINALVASDYIIIPLQCEYYSLEGLGQLLHSHQLIQRNLNPSLEVGGVLMTMADFRTNLTEQVIEEVKGHFGDRVFKSIIPRSVKLSEAPSFGKPAVFYDPSNKASKSYKDAAKEFMEKFANDKKTKEKRVETENLNAVVESKEAEKEAEIETKSEA